MFRGLSCFIVFLSATSHTRKTPRQTHDVSGIGRVYSVGGGGSGVFLHASALFRYVRVYIGSNSAGNRGVSEYTPDGLPFIGSQSGLNRDYIGSYYQYLVTAGVLRDNNR